MSRRASIPPLTALEEMMDNIPIQLWQMSYACTYGRANAAHAAFLGRPRVEIEQQPIESVLPSADAAAAITQTRSAFEQKHPVEIEQWRRDGAGRRRLLHIVMTPVTDETGAPLFLSCCATDVTDQREAALALQHCREQMDKDAEKKLSGAADALWGTVSSLVHQAESRDAQAGAHLRRLSESCRVVASILSLNSIYSHSLSYDFIYKLQQACLLHDIGKADIPERILLKPDKLTREEFDEIKKHTVLGAQALERAYQHLPKGDIFRMASDIALYHHERWDGKGYPKGLKGDDIPLSAQIVAICDVYDALRSPRPYKPALPHEESMLEIRHECGTQFNPALCDAFFQCAEELRHIFESGAA